MGNKNMHPAFYLNINYHNDILRFPIDFILNEQPTYSKGFLTTNDFLAKQKYLLKLEDTRFKESHEFDDSILGLITNQIPTMRFEQPILIIDKKYIKMITEIVNSGEFQISIETISFRKKFVLLFAFMVETPQVMFICLLFIVLVKILPIVDRKLLMKDVLKRKKINLNEDLFDSCSICLEKYKKDDFIGETVCKHKYHEDCFHDWVKHSDLCPICKNNLFCKQMSLLSEIYTSPHVY